MLTFIFLHERCQFVFSLIFMVGNKLCSNRLILKLDTFPRMKMVYIWITSHAAQHPSFIFLELAFVIITFIFIFLDFIVMEDEQIPTKVTRSQQWSDILQIQIVIPQRNEVSALNPLYWLVVWLLHPLFCIYEKERRLFWNVELTKCYVVILVLILVLVIVV